MEKVLSMRNLKEAVSGGITTEDSERTLTAEPAMRRTAICVQPEIILETVITVKQEMYWIQWQSRNKMPGGSIIVRLPMQVWGIRWRH